MHEVKENFLNSKLDERLVALQEDQAAALKEERATFDKTHSMFADMLVQEEKTISTCKEVHSANRGNRELQNQVVGQLRQKQAADLPKLD